MTASPPQLRVLVVDDDAIMRELLSALLSVEGHTVETAEDGESALRGLHHGQTPQVVLTDMQLPGLSGKALAAELRTAAPGATLLAMSGSQPKAETRDAFDGFLLKPFTPADFTAATAAARQPGKPIADEEIVPGNVSEGAAFDQSTYARLAQSLAPGPLAELYSLTLQDITERLARMDQARESGDFVTYRSEAHALKGGCSMVGAAELARLAAQAESPESSLSDTASPRQFAAAAERLRSILTAHFGRGV